MGQWAIRHRWLVLAGAAAACWSAAACIGGPLKQQFMPKDLSQLAFIDVFLPEDASFSSTSEAVTQVEKIVQEVVGRGEDAGRGAVQLRRRRRAALLVFAVARTAASQLRAGRPAVQGQAPHASAAAAHPEPRLAARLPSARIDVRQLENGDSVGLPVAIRISGEDAGTLRATAERVKTVFREIPLATRVRDNWGEDRFNVELKVDADRANLAGLTNLRRRRRLGHGDQRQPSLTTLREGDKQIPVVARLRSDEIAGLNDSTTSTSIPAPASRRSRSARWRAWTTTSAAK